LQQLPDDPDVMQTLPGKHEAHGAIHAIPVVDGGPQVIPGDLRILYGLPGQPSDFPEMA
jgi:hypothetical protein